jgi:hypothetical protein
MSYPVFFLRVSAQQDLLCNSLDSCLVKTAGAVCNRGETMNRAVVCLLSLITVSLLSCNLPTSPSTNNSKGNQQPSQTGFVTFKVNGVQQQLTQMAYGAFDTSNGKHIAAVVGENNAGTASQIAIFITFNDTSVGSHGADSTASIAYAPDTSVTHLATTKLSSVQPIITVSSFGPVNGYVEGTFSGVAKNSLGQIDSIVDGTFKVLRINIDSTMPLTNPPTTDTNYLSVLFNGQTINYAGFGAATSVCSLTTLWGLTSLSKMAGDLSLEIFGTGFRVGGTYSGPNRVSCVFFPLPGTTIETWDPLVPTVYRTGVIPFAVIDSISKSDDQANPSDTFSHMDSSNVFSVSVNLAFKAPKYSNGTIVGSFVSGTFSGQVGSDDPRNLGLNYPIYPPLRASISGAFSVFTSQTPCP